MLTAYDITGEEFHHTREDVDTLHQLAGLLPFGGHVVNIGACFGTSALALAETRYDITVFSIDIRSCPDEVEAFKRAGRSDQLFQVWARSQEIVNKWRLTPSLVFVDGAHDYASVKADIELWWPKLGDGGIMALHDYGTPSLPHVKRAIDECCVGWNQLLHHGTIKAFRK